jgi:hypothetical protein
MRVLLASWAVTLIHSPLLVLENSCLAYWCHGWKSSVLNLDQPKTMSTERLLEDVVLMLEYHKLDTLFMAYVPTVFQKGNTGPLMVSAYQALKKRRYFRRFAGLGYIS